MKQFGSAVCSLNGSTVHIINGSTVLLLFFDFVAVRFGCRGKFSNNPRFIFSEPYHCKLPLSAPLQAINFEDESLSRGSPSWWYPSLLLLVVLLVLPWWCSLGGPPWRFFSLVVFLGDVLP